MMFEDTFNRTASRKKALAVEFTDMSLRIMQLEGSVDQPKVRSFVEAQLPTGSIMDGVIKDPDKVGLLLLSSLERGEPRSPDTQYAIAIIPQRYVFQISIDLPQVEKEELRSLITRQVEDLIPTPLSEVYWDWHRIGLVNNKIRIQVGAVSKSLIDSYMQVFNAAKLTPLSFEPGGSVVGRLLPQNNEKYDKGIGDKEVRNEDSNVASTSPAKNENKIITVHAEREYVIICLLHERELIFATELKVNWGHEQESLQQISRKLDEVTQFSILKSISEYHDRPAIRLYGDSELVLLLEKNLPLISKLEVSKFRFKASGHQVLEFLTKESKDAYIELIGAAINGLPKYIDPGSLNFLPDAAKKMFSKKEFIKLLRNYLTVLALDIALIVLLLLVVSVRVDAKKKEFEEQLVAASALSNSERIIAVKQSVTELNNQTLNLSALITKLYDWEKFTDMLSQTTPNGITLSSVSVQPINSGGASTAWSVVISGVGNNRNQVLSYLDALRGFGLLSEVKLPLESLEELDNVLFTIEAELPFVNLLPNETDQN